MLLLLSITNCLTFQSPESLLTYVQGDQEPLVMAESSVSNITSESRTCIRRGSDACLTLGVIT